jgi:hypothetical protein
VVQQLEVVRTAEVHPVVDIEWDLPPLSGARGARVAHEQVADD